MAIARTSTRWARWVNQTTRQSQHTVRSRLSRQHGYRMTYASQGPHHGTKKAGSDLPWYVSFTSSTALYIEYAIISPLVHRIYTRLC